MSVWLRYQLFCRRNTDNPHHADQQPLIIPRLADWCCNSLPMLRNFRVENLQNHKKLKNSPLEGNLPPR
jgi:hypothetical protein